MFKRWTEGSLYCFESKQDCSNCNLHTVFGYHPSEPGRKCHMPESIEMLFKLNIKPPKSHKILSIVEALPLDTPFTVNEVLLEIQEDRIKRLAFLRQAVKEKLIEVIYRPSRPDPEKGIEIIYIRKSPTN